MKTLILVSVLALVGCGGAEFSEDLFASNGGDGNGGETTGTGGETGGTQGMGGDAPDAEHATGGDSGQEAGSSGGATGSAGGGTGGDGSGGGAQDSGVSQGGGGNATTGGGASSSTGGASTGGSIGCALVTHNNGLGQTWQDCEPLGTYNSAQAMKACAASGAVACLESTRCGTTVYEVQGWNSDFSQLIGEWGYGNFVTGYVSPNYNLCGTTNDPAVRRWD